MTRLRWLAVFLSMDDGAEVEDAEMIAVGNL